MTSLHATCIAINGAAILIMGASGRGKSDLALRLIDRGAQLVSDDYTDVLRDGDTLRAAPPSTITGKIEVRGIGIIEMPYVRDIPVALMIDLDGVVERMPLPNQTTMIAGLPIASITLAAHDASTPIKVELALKQVISQI
jgi:serine kinase of HPr protein (carbohydrate metabolism regulator)